MMRGGGVSSAVQGSAAAGGSPVEPDKLRLDYRRFAQWMAKHQRSEVVDDLAALLREEFLG